MPTPSNAAVKFEGASKFAVAAAHRLLTDASNVDVVLVSFELLKLHEKFLAYSDELELLAQLRGLTSANRGLRCGIGGRTCSRNLT
jgi:hypothetical protein